MSEIYKKAREFAKKYIDPFVVANDENKAFAVETFKEIANEGYFSLVIPKEYGGAGLGIEEHAEICMAFAESSASVGLCYMMSNVALFCLNKYGSDELKKEVFKSIVEEKKFAALAYSELGSGTHFYMPDTTAKFDADTTTLNGLKSMVTSGGYASYYLVLARGKDGIDNWCIPLGTQGLEFLSNSWNGLGMRANVSCQMKMDNLKLSNKYRIGSPDTGMEQVFNGIAPLFVCGLAAVYSGVCKAILNEAISHSTTRKYGDDKPLCSIETVQIHLAKIYAKTNAAVLGTKEAAKAIANGEEEAFAKLLSARIFASESAIELANIGMRIGGGKAYNKFGNMERYLRDSLASQIMAPSVDVLTIWLGKAITGQEI